MAETDILLSGTIDFILQCAIYCLPDVIIKYVRCKKNPMAAWDFCMGGKSSDPARGKCYKRHSMHFAPQN